MTEPARTTGPKTVATAPSAPTAPGPRPVAAAAPGPAALPPSARELRRARARRLALQYAIFVALPTILAIVYYGALASRQYDASAVISIESNDPAASQPVGRGSTTGHQRDARLLRDHVQSRLMLERLNADQDLVAHYQDASVDWWSRLADDASRDETYDYFRDKVSATIDPHSGALRIRVRAFAPDRAEALLTALVEAARAWVRELSERARREQLEPAEQEVNRARQRLVEARHAMLAVTAGAEPTPEQLADPVVVEHELAELAMSGALDGLQRARVAAASMQRYLMVIDPPARPDQAARPRFLWDVATVFVTCLVTVSVLLLLGAAVREHANF